MSSFINPHVSEVFFLQQKMIFIGMFTLLFSRQMVIYIVSIQKEPNIRVHILLSLTIALYDE